jgi:putative CocE/NonD family hydrolase
MWVNLRKSFIFFTIFALFSSLLLPPSAVQAEDGQPLENIIIEDMMVEMKDGIKLATRVYRPKAEGKYPVLLSRTPYNSGAFQKDKTGNPMLGDYANVATQFVPKGYAVVIQDARGKFASEGVNRPFLDDMSDGTDTLNWIAGQEWSDQKVGTFGASARGMTQTAMLDVDSPYLKAMFVIIAPSEYFEEVLFQGGAYRQELVQVWRAGQNISDAAKKFGPTSPQFLNTLTAYQNIPNSLYWYLPLRDFPTLSSKYETGSDYDQMFDHYIKDGHFDYMDISLKHKDSNVPTYQVGGWHDIFREGSIKNFAGLQANGGEGAKGNQKLLMGPWQHRDIGDSPRFEGDEIDIYGEMNRWFDYWLKGIDNGIMNEKPVKYFTMGSNEWKEADSWPAQAEEQVYYFHQTKSGSADSLNDGTLAAKKPNAQDQAETYVYDPNDPTITIGGDLLFPDVNIQNEKGEDGKVKQLVGPEDQREAEKSSLTYTTTKLSEDVSITGQVSATVYASSDRLDTDFVVRLTDVAPDGTSTLILDGIQRARFRDGQDKEVFMEAGQVYPFEINLGNTSHTFKKGHQIRVAVASSNFPKFDRNTNSGKPIGSDGPGSVLKATNSIYQDALYPSHISLPVVKGKGKATAAEAPKKNVKIQINGAAASFSSFLQNGTTYASLRALGEALGAQVEWDEAAKAVTLVKGTTTLKLAIGSSAAVVNGNHVQMNGTAAIHNGSTMVPVRFITEALQAIVQWNSGTNTVSIDTK